MRPANPTDPNLRPAINDGEESASPPDFVKSFREDGNVIDSGPNIDDPPIPEEREPPPVFDPEDLIGRTFLTDTKSDGQKLRARIVELLEDHESDLESNPTRIRFKVKYDHNQQEEIISYNQCLEHIMKDEETDIIWKHKCITSHQGP